MEKNREFEVLLAANRKSLETYCRARCRASCISPGDLQQETETKAFIKFNQFRTGTNFLAWINTIASTTFLDMVRASNKEGQKIDPNGEDAFLTLVDHAADPKEKLLRAEASSQIHEALAQLPPRQRTLVAYYYLYGHSQDECAKLLGIPPGSVRNTLARARERLRESLEDYFAT